MRYNVAVDDETRARAAERRKNPARWPIRSYPLGKEPPLDPLDATSIDDRLAAMWPLATQAWELGGRKVPSWERGRAPGKLSRRTVP